MAAKYYLDRPGPDGRCTVRLALLRGRQQKWINLPLRVAPRDWNKRRGRLRASAPGAVEVNARLERIQHRAEALLLDGLPLDDVAGAIREDLGLQGATHDLMGLFEEWLEVKAVRVRPSSLEVLRRIRLHLEAFLPRGATVAVVDRAFLERYQAFLAQHAGLSHATANRHVSYTKNFLKWLHGRGLIPEVPEVAPLPESRRDAVFLTPHEIKAIEGADLSDLPEGYERARFLLLLACYTGLRVSDLKEGMKPPAWGTIDLEEGVWLLREHKTNVFHRWPLVSPARRMLRERREAGARTPVPRISEQRANRYLKEVARLAGIEAPVRLPGGETRPKWQVLSLHSGRRSFITTVVHEAGTGALLGLTHADLDTLQRYVGSWDDARRRRIEAAFRGM
ncbi:site-specific integrase [Rhodocaloribacter litoris]|uniref:tyrosine-type recombinase/integrase n=1 Tax=Rhodocaloribacter litoris TaxID=2558931 RepID=UPI001422A269|nr:tyrosine-type recombinase/integrase [Rhodocaloribacter litoris]QXD16992.1 site-specific integrase [Rhodocaloribacter litoris]